MIRLRSKIVFLNLCFSALMVVSPSLIADQPSENPSADIKPVLSEYCFGCHGDGAEEGGVSFDDLLEMEDETRAQSIWHRVLKQVRADLMPPIDESQPSDKQLEKIEAWIIRQPLGVDPARPNPGELTVRRLNRVEYRNTIRDLLNVEFDTSVKFPADDTGHGFDNISDVLSVSPLLLEKYFIAAEEIIGSVVPTQRSTVVRKNVSGAKFVDTDSQGPEIHSEREGYQEFSYYKAATAKASFEIANEGQYRLSLRLAAIESYVDEQFDGNECELTFILDDQELSKRVFVRQGGKRFNFDFENELSTGTHSLEIRIKPTTNKEQVRNLRLVLKEVGIAGPLNEKYFVKPPNYDRFFPRDVPADSVARREYAGELQGTFATRAFRRPVDQRTVSRLADLAETTYSSNGATFEMGVAKGMTAVLASPRFIFREEFAQSAKSPQSSDESGFPLIDEHSLASRISYFLWSTMPDEELINLASQGTLQKNLDEQIERMVRDERFESFVKNFAGQWLQARTIESVQISSRSVNRRDAKPDPVADEIRKRFFSLARKGSDRTEEENELYEAALEDFRSIRRRNEGQQVELDRKTRRAMRQETEMLLSYVIKEDRSLLELVDSNYTFLNERLANYYQIDGVEGREMRYVELADDSVRGGVLTQGTVLVVTSNPDRTSPVKRGLFVLENLLGTPTSAPPPNLPSLEDQEDKNELTLSLRESLELHRQDPTCSSCHNRMDPLGLRGLGACMALPTMESLLPASAIVSGSAAPSLATTATGAPLRTAFLFFPNGAIPKAWWPETSEKDFELSPTLKPLGEWKKHVQVLKGLDNKSAEGRKDGAGDHARGNATFLTGVRLNKSATDIRAGKSIDQVIANQVGHLTRFPSIELASDPIRQSSNCDSGYSCAYQYNISWQSETTPMATESNPRLVFERLFGSGAPGERAKSLENRRASQQSILDFVMEDARAMQTRMQHSDRKKLDEYLTGVRELERRIQRAESFDNPVDPAIETPVGIPSSHVEYVNLMYELTVLAFQTDSTRVASLMLGHDGDNRSYDFLGVSEGHHELTHHQNKAERINKVQRIDRWYVEQFAKFLKRMAGGGGGELNTGRYVDHKGVPLTNLYLSMAEKMGVDSLERFGDSNSVLGDLQLLSGWHCRVGLRLTFEREKFQCSLLAGRMSNCYNAGLVGAVAQLVRAGDLSEQT